MNRKFPKITSVAAAAALCVCLASCAETQSSDTESKSENVTAAPAVTLPPESEAEESSSAEDSSNTDSGDYTPAVWLVTSPKGETMYMMGSMHALRDECYPLPDYVLSAYEQADVLAVECDISDATSSFSAGLKQMEKMNYTDGTTLKDHVSEDVYSGIESYLSAHGEDISLCEDYQLWYLSQYLDGFALEDAELDSTKGLDITLLTQAHSDGKEIYEVESIDFQMDLLTGFSEDIYEVMLSGYSAENSDEIAEQYVELYNAWRTGDTETIERLNTGDTEELTDEQKTLLDDYNKQLLYDRNIGMAQAAEQLMSDGKNVFYMVGAAHFVGEGGIIDLLEKDGYTAELVKE